MKTISQIFSILVALLLLGALAFAGIAAIEYVGTLYMSLDPQFARVAAICLFAVLVAAWAIAHGIRRATAQRMRQQLADEISATYRFFMDYWIELMDQGPQAGGDPEAQQALDRLMALHAGTEALKAHLALRALIRKQDVSESEIRAQFGKALIAIRKDLGAGTQGVAAQELQQLVLPEQNPEIRAVELPQC